MMNFEMLEAFVAAAESESFFNTKGDPHRFQSSASKEILELERELGIGDAQFVNVHDLAVELFRVMVGNIGRITV